MTSKFLYCCSANVLVRENQQAIPLSRFYLIFLQPESHQYLREKHVKALGHKDGRKATCYGGKMHGLEMEDSVDQATKSLPFRAKDYRTACVLWGL